MDSEISFESTVTHAAIILFLAPSGLIADWLMNDLTSYEYFGFAVLLGIFLPLIVSWTRDWKKGKRKILKN